MSDNDKKNQPEYTVDEILAEYSSGKYKKPKVVEFPDRDSSVQDEEPTRVIRPKRSAQPRSASPGAPSGVRQNEARIDGGEADDELPEIHPDSIGLNLAARVHTLLRRADHYADHMYDHAEPDEATRKAERYIPGVDEEEIPPQPRRPVRRPKPSRAAPPDTAPAELSARFARGAKARGVRSRLAFLSALACAAVSLELPALFDWTAQGGELPLSEVRLLILLACFALTGALCGDILVRGLAKLAVLRPGAETILSIAFLFTLADTAAVLLTGWRSGLPCCAVTAFGMAFALRGDTLHRKGDRLSARAAAQSKSPYVVTLDEGAWSGRPAYSKWSGSQTGFGSQLQMEDGAQRAYLVAAPLLILACLVCATLSAARAGDGKAFLWTASATLTAACAWTCLLVYAAPYHKLARRLFNMGAALAGWPGAARCRAGGIVMTDNDLFPTGCVQVSGVRVFGEFANEKVVSYAATLLRVLDCGLTRPFHDLLRAQGSFYREASGVRYHEGGVTGIIRNHEVFVGTAAFMHLMDVPMPQGLNVKHAIFCAINGELAGIFALNYTMSPTVDPCLSALMREGASPILATRDPNLIPALLGQKFKLPVDKMEFPPVDRRLDLSGPEREHDTIPVALLSREGLAPYCDAVVGGRRLRAATRWGLAFAMLGSVLGVVLTFYLTYIGAVASLTPFRFLVFMALWLAPEFALYNWVNQY